MNLFEEMAKDAGNIEVSDDEVSTLSELCKSLQTVETKIEATKEYLKTLEEIRDDLSMNKIPNKLMELGVSEMKLSNWTKVSTDKKYLASISKDKDKSKAAFDWLVNNGHGAIIKKQIVIPYTYLNNDGEVSKESQNVFNDLEKLGVTYMDEGNIHWATLRAFVKEQMEEGKEFPKDLFNVFVQNVTKLK